VGKADASASQMATASKAAASTQRKKVLLPEPLLRGGGEGVLALRRAQGQAGAKCWRSALLGSATIGLRCVSLAGGDEGGAGDGKVQVGEEKGRGAGLSWPRSWLT
jgi:hypothetical protein